MAVAFALAATAGAGKWPPVEAVGPAVAAGPAAGWDVHPECIAQSAGCSASGTPHCAVRPSSAAAVVGLEIPLVAADQLVGTSRCFVVSHTSCVVVACVDVGFAGHAGTLVVQQPIAVVAEAVQRPPNSVAGTFVAAGSPFEAVDHPLVVDELLAAACAQAVAGYCRRIVVVDTAGTDRPQLAVGDFGSIVAVAEAECAPSSFESCLATAAANVVGAACSLVAVAATEMHYSLASAGDAGADSPCPGFVRQKS